MSILCTSASVPCSNTYVTSMNAIVRCNIGNVICSIASIKSATPFVTYISTSFTELVPGLYVMSCLVHKIL